ncbi:MAG: hypothetical protein EXS17_02955 [Phycisphaerales bacterium]|nr:hypothetical protein [Phycisphaerales bacterium]
MEFVSFAEIWPSLRTSGVEEVKRSDQELRLSLAESSQSSSIELAAIDHPTAPALPADLIQFDRKRLAELVEGIVHKLHLTEVSVIPIGHWRQLFEAVAQGMGSIEKWRAIDSAAIVELNTRDALTFAPADFQILRQLVYCVLTAGSETVHGIALVTTGSALLIEVLPVGEVVVYTGRTDLQRVVADFVAHAHALANQR